MTIPNIHTWLAGDEFNAMRMNEVADAIAFLQNPPMVHVGRRLTTQSIPSSVWTKITFDTVYNGYDPYGMWDSGTPDQITIVEPGWYSCEVHLSLAATSTDTRVILGLYKNGLGSDDLLLRYDQTTPPSGGNQNLRRETTLFMNAGDFLHAACWLNSLSLNSQITSDAESSGLRVRWVSN